MFPNMGDNWKLIKTLEIRKIVHPTVGWNGVYNMYSIYILIYIYDIYVYMYIYTIINYIPDYEIQV